MRYLFILLIVLLLPTLAMAQCQNCPNGRCNALQLDVPAYYEVQLPPAPVQATAKTVTTTEVTASIPAASEVQGIRRPLRSAIKWFSEHKPLRKAVAGVFRFIFHRRR
jgi:hypothetical protein